MYHLLIVNRGDHDSLTMPKKKNVKPHHFYKIVAETKKMLKLHEEKLEKYGLLQKVYKNKNILKIVRKHC